MSEDADKRFPLAWPENVITTKKRYPSRYLRGTPRAEFLKLKKELVKFGITDVVVSTNCFLRCDGDPVLQLIDPEVSPGVCVHGVFNERDIFFCYDTFENIWENYIKIREALYFLRKHEEGMKFMHTAGFRINVR